MEKLKPVVKWAGGKRQLLGELKKHVPDFTGVYCEPFIGGAALLFELQPEKAVVNDANPQLIEVYEVIRDSPEELIASLKKHENTPEYYYAIREIDRNKEAFARMSPVERASRFIYLNHTCFNGLYRVNAKGEFNVPFGKYKNPAVCDEENIRAVSRYFNRADIRFCTGDFANVLQDLPEGSFVYLDPPYVPLSPTASFTSYTAGGFNAKDQERLKEECDRLNKRGIRFLESNSDTEFCRELYKDYAIETVSVRRNINADASKRAGATEILMHN